MAAPGTTSFERSEWQQKSVPTVRVTNSRGSKVQDAIDRAAPYTRLVLTAGNYNEQLSINKPIELVADDGEEPCFVSRGPCITVYGDIDCYISNITVRNKTSGSGNSGKEPPGILISGGRPVLHRIEATSIGVAGSAEPHISECMIFGNVVGHGLAIRDRAAGTYTKNRIWGHAGHCVFVSSKGQPTLSENEIEASHHDPKLPAGKGVVLVSGAEASPIFKSNRISDPVKNAPEGSPLRAAAQKFYTAGELLVKRAIVTVESFATPMFSDNGVVGGVVCFSLKSCGGTFTNNHVTEAVACGVLVTNRTTAQLFQNQVQVHGCFGVVIDSAEPQLTGNMITNNKHYGIFVHSTGASMMIEKNHIERNGVGIYARDESYGSVEHNEVRANITAAFQCRGAGSALRFVSNTVVSNGEFGAVCEMSASPVFSNTAFFGHNVGVLVSTAAAPIVEDCTIGTNTDSALVCRENGRGIFRRCKMTHGAKGIVVIADAGNPRLEENTIEDGSGSAAVLVHEGGIGLLVGNTVSACPVGIMIRLYADPIVHKNRVVMCGENGISVEEEGIGTITENSIEDCPIGLAAHRGGEPTFRRNTVVGSSRIGILLGTGNRATAEYNTVSRCIDGIVIEGDECDSIVRRNECLDNKYGITSRKGGFGFVEGNRTRASREGGFGTVDHGVAYFLRNRAEGDDGPGLFCSNNGRGEFRECVCRNGVGAGARLSSGAQAKLIDCEFANNKGPGIDVTKGAGGTVTTCHAEFNGVGIRFHDHSSTVVDRFVAEHNRESGGMLAEMAQAELRGCTFRDQPVGLCVRSAGECVVEDCVFERNVVGVESIMGGAPVKVRRCTFSDSTDAHVVFHSSGEAVVCDCAFEDGTVAVRSHDRGKGVVRDCSMSRFTVAGVVLEKEGATRIEGCTINNCAIGVHSTTSSDGDVHSCTLSSNRCNVRTDSRGNATFRDCKIEHATATFGCIFEGAGRLTRCTVAHNKYGGVYIGGAGKPRLTECTISQNGGCGVASGEKSEGLLQKNTITENDGFGIRLRQGCGTHFLQNTVSSNAEGGLLGERACGGLLVENTFVSNRGSNLRLLGMSNSRFEKNLIKDAAIGIVVEGSSCHIQHNVISGHTEAGILICGKSICIFTGNEVCRNRYGVDFVLYRMDAPKPPPRSRRGSVARSRANSNANSPSRPQVSSSAAGSGGGGPSAPGSSLEPPLQMGPAGSPTSASPRTDHFAALGSLSPKHLTALTPGASRAPSPVPQAGGDTSPTQHNGSSAVFRTNTFRANTAAGVRYGDRCVAKMHANVFEDEAVGIELTEKAGGVVDENRFLGNDVGIDVTGDFVGTKISLNLFEKNRHVGLRVRHNAMLDVCENLFRENLKIGLLMTGNFGGAAKKNEFVGDAIGISIDGGSEGAVIENVFERCTCGVQVMPTGNPVIRRSLFYDGNIGVLSSDSRGSVEGCVFRGSMIAGVCVESPSCVLAVRKCLFANCKSFNTSSGVTFRNNANAVVTGCDFHGCAMGVKVEDNARGDVSSCLFHNNQHGVHASEGGATRINACVFAANTTADVCSTLHAAPTVSRCFFKGESETCLLLIDLGGGEFSENVLRGALTAAVTCIGASNAAVSKNMITKNPVGVACQGVACAETVISDNVIDNGTTGVVFRDGGAAIVELNAIRENDLGALLKNAGPACLERNHITKSNRGGIAITDVADEEATVRFNFIDGATQFGINIQGETTVARVLENVVLNSRINLSLASGAALVAQNQSSQGEIGLQIYEAFKGVCEGNVIHSNRRCGCICSSPHVRLSRNCFYSSNDGGALEVECETSSRQLHGNDVKNQFTPHWAKPDVPVKVLLPAPVKESAALAEERTLVEQLRQLFLGANRADLPECPERHCPFLAGDSSASVSEIAASRLHRRRSVQAFIPSVATHEKKQKPSPAEAARAIDSPETDDDAGASTTAGNTNKARRRKSTAGGGVLSPSGSMVKAPQGKAKVQTFNKIRKVANARRAFNSGNKGGNPLEGPTSDEGELSMSESGALSPDSSVADVVVQSQTQPNSGTGSPDPADLTRALSEGSVPRPVKFAGPPALRTAQRGRSEDPPHDGHGTPHRPPVGRAQRPITYTSIRMGFDGAEERQHTSSSVVSSPTVVPATRQLSQEAAGQAQGAYSNFVFEFESAAAGGMPASSGPQGTTVRGGSVFGGQPPPPQPRPPHGDVLAGSLNGTRIVSPTRERGAAVVYERINSASHQGTRLPLGLVSGTSLGSPRLPRDSGSALPPRPPSDASRIRQAFGSSNDMVVGSSSSTELPRGLQPTSRTTPHSSPQGVPQTEQPAAPVLSGAIAERDAAVANPAAAVKPPSAQRSARPAGTVLPQLSMRRMETSNIAAAAAQSGTVAASTVPRSFELRTQQLRGRSKDKSMSPTAAARRERPAPWVTPQAEDLNTEGLMGVPAIPSLDEPAAIAVESPLAASPPKPKQGRVVTVDWLQRKEAVSVDKQSEEQHRKNVMAGIKKGGADGSSDMLRLLPGHGAATATVNLAAGNQHGGRTFGGWATSARNTPGIAALYPPQGSRAPSQQPSTRVSPQPPSSVPMPPQLVADAPEPVLAIAEQQPDGRGANDGGGRTSGWLLDGDVRHRPMEVPEPTAAAEDPTLPNPPLLPPRDPQTPRPRRPPVSQSDTHGGFNTALAASHTVDMAKTASRLIRHNARGQDLGVQTNYRLMSPAAAPRNVPTTADGAPRHRQAAPLARPKHRMSEVVVMTPVGTLHSRGASQIFRPKLTASGGAVAAMSASPSTAR